MLRDVLQQRGFIHETLVTGVALVGFVRLVASGVRLEVGELRKGLGATRMAAFVGLVPCVGADVLLQVRQLGELSLADFAAVGLNAQVDAGVLREVGRIGEALGALRALVRFRLAHVNLGVELQVGLGTEHLKYSKVSILTSLDLRQEIVVTNMKFHIKTSRFRVMSRFKESKRPDRGHTLNRDFTVRSFSTVTSRFNESLLPPSSSSSWFSTLI